jgi:FtsH-binding integral membrane protein
MHDNSYENDAVSETQALAIVKFVSNMYLWMALAFTITGLTAAYINGFFGWNQGWNKILFFCSFILFFIEAGIVVFVSSRAMSLSFSTARILYVLFSIMNGVVLSFFFFLFRVAKMDNSMETLATMFYISAGTLSIMSFINYFRYEDLSTLGRFLIITTTGVIITTIVNYILESSQMMSIVNYAGVLILCGFAAYETKNIKKKFLEIEGDKNEATLKISFLGSLALYLGIFYILVQLIDAYGDSRK